jgi:hypothetical protein
LFLLLLPDITLTFAAVVFFYFCRLLHLVIHLLPIVPLPLLLSPPRLLLCPVLLLDVMLVDARCVFLL